MKVLINVSALMLALGFLFSCEMDGELTQKKGFVQFNYKQPPGGRVLSESEPAFAMVTIMQEGEIIKLHERLPLFLFGSGYISDPIELPTGLYTLTEFLILDSANTIIYASPIEGSEMAAFVDDPLPIDFEVSDNSHTLVVPEVLPVEADQTPESFGYVSFGFEVVEPIAKNSIVFDLDGERWLSSYAEPAAFNPELNFMAVVGHKFTDNGGRESVWIMFNNFNFELGEVPSGDVELQVGFFDAQWNGPAFDSDWGEPKEVSAAITYYDSATQEISGTFEGVIYNPATGTSKNITKGIFYRLKVRYEEPSDTTVTFQPDDSTGVDAPLFNCVECGYPNLNLGNHPDFLATAWTNDGYTSDVRSLIYFDLASIPADAQIKEAKLSLYSNITINGPHSQLSGSNQCFLQRVTSPWNEMTVTWNNQPGTTDVNQVIVPASTSATQDYTIDITELIQELHANPENNFGMMLRLATEEKYRALVFASSDYADATKRPKLEITYE